MEPFLFYVMTENDEYGCHFVGYFSKEKRPSSQNNVSCILVLPIHQRRGFGHMLIDFSYLLTKTEHKTGSPEKPLSDMGLVSYRSYWRLVLCHELVGQEAALSIADISDRTGMTADDIVCALEGLRALVRDPLTRTYALRLDLEFFRKYIENYENKGYAKINSNCLMWTPYVMGKDNAHYENTPHISTVAQREEDDDVEPEEGVQLAASGISTKDYGALDVDAGSAALATDEHEPPSLESAEPFPVLPPDIQQQAKRSPKKADTPNTPTAEELEAPIPASRFEVFPPIPGTATSRKRGRPFGSARTRRMPPFTNSPSLSHKPSSLRQSRTTLAETEDDDFDEPDAEGDPMDVEARPEGHEEDAEGDEE